MRNYKRYLQALPTHAHYLPEYDCHLKEEYTLPSGSHKDRETVNLLLKQNDRDCLCVTTGNAGISLAYYMGKKARIFVPATCSPEKVILLQQYGSQVIMHGKTYCEAWHEGIKLAKRMGWRNISPGAEQARYEGDAAITKEIPYASFIFVPASNHTLAYGIAMGRSESSRTIIVSVVLPNHPFLTSKQNLTDEEIEGYESIATTNKEVQPYLEKRWLGLKNTRIETVSREDLKRIREQNAHGSLDLAVYLALEVSRKYHGKKVVIGTGVRR